MKNLYVRAGFIGLLGIILSVSLSAQGREGGAGARGAGQGPRGEAAQNRGARGERGGANEVAEQRKAVQARQKSAIEQENSTFRLTMQSIQSNARNAKDPNARTAAKMEAAAAQRNHQAALQRIRAEAQSAMAALKR